MSSEYIVYQENGLSVENGSILLSEITGFAFDFDETIAWSTDGAGADYTNGADTAMIDLIIEFKSQGHRVIILTQKPVESVVQAINQLGDPKLLTIEIHSTRSSVDQETVSNFYGDEWYKEQFASGYKYPTAFGCNVLVDDSHFYTYSEPETLNFAVIRKGKVDNYWGQQVREILVENSILAN
jgi:hypothetical protein